jgi:hypothetical protein
MVNPANSFIDKLSRACSTSSEQLQYLGTLLQRSSWPSGDSTHCRGVQRARENMAKMLIPGSAKYNKQKRKKSGEIRKRERRTEKEDNVQEWKWL